MDDFTLEEQTIPEEVTTEAETTQEPEEPTYKVKYNGEEMELPLADLITNAQKGMNYDHVKEDLEKTRNTSTASQASLERLLSALNQFGYDGEAQDIADALEAQARDTTPEAVKQEREEAERIKEQKAELDSKLEELLRFQQQAVFNADLAEIQKLDPSIKSLDELGADFYGMRANNVSVAVAYRAIKESLAPSNPSTGDIKTTGNSEDGLFTMEDVKKMSQAEVSKNWDKIQKSREKWR